MGNKFQHYYQTAYVSFDSYVLMYTRESDTSILFSLQWHMGIQSLRPSDNTYVSAGNPDNKFKRFVSSQCLMYL
jgi:hypothetical protein